MLGESGWLDVRATCFVPIDVDLAVVHLATRPHLRVPMPDGLLDDNVRMVTKVQPVHQAHGPVSMKANLS